MVEVNKIDNGYEMRDGETLLATFNKKPTKEMIDETDSGLTKIKTRRAKFIKARDAEAKKVEAAKEKANKGKKGIQVN